MARLGAERLAAVAFYYYVQGQSQSDIAARIGVTRSAVSRMLTAAREQGVIRFQVLFPYNRVESLERAIIDRFAATSPCEVIVTAAAGGIERDSRGDLLSIGRAAAVWLESNIRDDMVVALSFGDTIQAMVDGAFFPSQHRVRVVQMAGEMSYEVHRSGHDTVRDFARKLGAAQHEYFSAPAIAESVEAAESLRRTSQVQRSLDLSRNADIAIVGIGQFGSGSSQRFFEAAHATSEELAEARKKGAVGQMCGRLYNREGAPVDIAIDRRVLSIDLPELKQIRSKVAVAGGAAKGPATAAAIRGGYIDHLIIDEELARAVLADPHP